MTIIQDFVPHSERMQKMAETIGVDLGQAVLAGKLRNFPISDMVFRCSRCLEKTACEAWVGAHKTGATEVPDFCRNKILLEGLQA